MKYEEYTVKIFDNGDKFYYQGTGQLRLHRLDGPAVEYGNGSKSWYQNDRLHRVAGPAIERANGDKLWYENNYLHRLDGPAVESADGIRQWFINGIQFSKENFEKDTQSLKKSKSPSSCDNKIVEIDGLKYKLSLVSK